jgi:hypothetical protein
MSASVISIVSGDDVPRIGNTDFFDFRLNEDRIINRGKSGGMSGLAGKQRKCHIDPIVDIEVVSADMPTKTKTGGGGSGDDSIARLVTAIQTLLDGITAEDSCMTDNACDACQEAMQQLIDMFNQLENLLGGSPTVQADDSIGIAEEVQWLENLYKLKDKRRKKKSV